MKKTIAAVVIAFSLFGPLAAVAEDVLTPGKPVARQHGDAWVHQIRAIWSQFLRIF